MAAGFPPTRPRKLGPGIEPLALGLGYLLSELAWITLFQQTGGSNNNRNFQPTRDRNREPLGNLLGTNRFSLDHGKGRNTLVLGSSQGCEGRLFFPIGRSVDGPGFGILDAIFPKKPFFPHFVPGLRLRSDFGRPGLWAPGWLSLGSGAFNSLWAIASVCHSGFGGFKVPIDLAPKGWWVYSSLGKKTRPRCSHYGAVPFHCTHGASTGGALNLCVRGFDTPNQKLQVVGVPGISPTTIV